MSQTYKNEVHLAGDLAKDPIVRATQSGQKVATITLVTKYKDKSAYHQVVCWDQLADKAERLTKGEFLKLVGRLQTRSWEDKSNGQKKYSTEVVAFHLAIPADELPPLTPDEIKSGTDVARSILRPAKESIGDEDIPF